MNPILAVTLLPALALAAPSPTPIAPKAAARTLPSRLIDCALARITNFDPSKDQKPSDYTFEGNHVFKLFLPPIPVRTTEPPLSTQPPEPVDPRTRIVADPDGLSQAAAKRRFGRVVDYWPTRVEMTTPLTDVAVNLIILDAFDAQAGTLNLFMTKANDAVTYDQAHLYSGKCKVTTGAAAEAAASRVVGKTS